MSKARSHIPFADVVRDRVRREPSFAAALLQEAVQCMLNGELEIANNLVRDVITGLSSLPDTARWLRASRKALPR